ncbi:protein GDAP2 homolog [Zingiber officinale]|nr:protein GDAP2 homolog [Zingiber officinale]
MPRRYSGIKRLFFPFRFPRSVPNSNLASLSHSNEQAMCSDRMDQILEEAFKIGGRDKKGRMVLRIVGKFFPAKDLAAGGGMDALRSFLERAVFPQLGGAPCVVVYMHACVQRADNYPGVAALRSVYEALPADVRDRIPAVYFVHPGLQSRLFFATVGRFFFSAGLYGKLKYVSRLEFLWEYIRRGEMEVPEFVQDHDDELEHRPLMDYGLFESDRHHSIFDAPAMESTASMHSLRCIS